MSDEDEIAESEFSMVRILNQLNQKFYIQIQGKAREDKIMNNFYSNQKDDED